MQACAVRTVYIQFVSTFLKVTPQRAAFVVACSHHNTQQISSRNSSTHREQQLQQPCRFNYSSRKSHNTQGAAASNITMLKEQQPYKLQQMQKSNHGRAAPAVASSSHGPFCRVADTNTGHPLSRGPQLWLSTPTASSNCLVHVSSPTPMSGPRLQPRPHEKREV
eukprot:1160429-Pelagomonas_calceolata.AAC.4